MLAPASSTSLLPGQIAYEPDQRIGEALASLGRTEDVRFSPSGRRLAIACYARNEIAVADVHIVRPPAGGDASVTVTGLELHDSPALKEPHGLDFVDDETLVVANRSGELTVLRLPPAGVRATAVTIGAIACELGAAGSVAARRRGPGESELLVVHNWADAVSRYRLSSNDTIAAGGVVLQRWLDLPDGLAWSASHDLLAVSNHSTHDVLVFESPLHRESNPVAIMRGVAYPHGLRFAHDDQLLLVADAGAPYVNVFMRPGDTWAGASYPCNSILVMDDDTFTAGRHDPQEGGPKGVDVDERTNVLVITAETAPLVFFDMELALEGSDTRPARDLVWYELERLRSRERAAAETAEVRKQLSAVLQTKAWRLMTPLRRLYGRLRLHR